jgi:hypothetical protein
MSTKDDKQSMFGPGIDPRERAAHIACAVVLTIVVLSVIVALIVYFTTDPTIVIKGDCDPIKLPVVDTQVKKVVEAPKHAAKKPQVVVKKAPVQRTAASAEGVTSATSFQSDSGMAAAVSGNAGSTVRQGQGVTVNPRMEQFTEHLASFAQNFQGALASQNPIASQITETPNSIHKSYQGDINTPHLKQEYVDSTLFPKMVKKWSEEAPLPFGRSEAYNDTIVRGQGIMVPGARI